MRIRMMDTPSLIKNMHVGPTTMMVGEKLRRNGEK